jgi:hypothetical protein
MAEHKNRGDNNNNRPVPPPPARPVDNGFHDKAQTPGRVTSEQAPPPRPKK